MYALCTIVHGVAIVNARMNVSKTATTRHYCNLANGKNVTFVRKFNDSMIR